MNVKTHQGKIKEKSAVVDFIETYGNPSFNNYEYDGEFDKNIQLNTRIFATTDAINIPFNIKILGKRTIQSPV